GQEKLLAISPLGCVFTESWVFNLLAVFLEMDWKRRDRKGCPCSGATTISQRSSKVRRSIRWWWHSPLKITTCSPILWLRLETPWWMLRLCLISTSLLVSVERSRNSKDCPSLVSRAPLLRGLISWP